MITIKLNKKEAAFFKQALPEWKKFYYYCQEGKLCDSICNKILKSEEKQINSTNKNNGSTRNSGKKQKGCS